MSNLLDTYDRVERTGQPCPICGHANWCLIHKDGYTSGVICAREQNDCQWGEAGWYYGPKRVSDQPRRFDWGEEIWVGKLYQRPEILAAYIEKKNDDAILARYVDQLGVSVQSLHRLGAKATWKPRDIFECISGAEILPPEQRQTGEMYIPMRPGQDPSVICGVHIRNPDGSKLSVKGSHLGLFIPEGLADEGTLYVVEGASDTAAGLDIGLDIIGRPSATACDSQIIDLLARSHYRRCVIIADHDEIGLRGGKKLKQAICRLARTSIITPPEGVKDLRQWRQQGCTIEAINQTVRGE